MMSAAKVDLNGALIRPVDDPYYNQQGWGNPQPQPWWASYNLAPNTPAAVANNQAISGGSLISNAIKQGWNAIVSPRAASKDESSATITAPTDPKLMQNPFEKNTSPTPAVTQPIAAPVKPPTITTPPQQTPAVVTTPPTVPTVGVTPTTTPPTVVQPAVPIQPTTTIVPTVPTQPPLVPGMVPTPQPTLVPSVGQPPMVGGVAPVGETPMLPPTISNPATAVPMPTTGLEALKAQLAQLISLSEKQAEQLTAQDKKIEDLSTQQEKYHKAKPTEKTEHPPKKKKKSIDKTKKIHVVKKPHKKEKATKTTETKKTEPKEPPTKSKVEDPKPAPKKEVPPSNFSTVANGSGSRSRGPIKPTE